MSTACGREDAARCVFVCIADTLCVCVHGSCPCFSRLDELPIWGMLGEYMMAEVPGAKPGESSVREQGFLYSHREFSISYNGRQIIEVNLTSENPRPIVAGAVIPLTFSVKWVETDKPFDSRFDRYLGQCKTPTDRWTDGRTCSAHGGSALSHCNDEERVHT